MNDRLNTIRNNLKAHNQEHLLAFESSLSDDQKDRLFEQIEALDLNEIDNLIKEYVTSKPENPIPADLQPAPYYPNDPTSAVNPYNSEQFLQAGETLIKEGRVAAFCVAGGQGTRLGWNGPKGSFPATAINGIPLFRVFAEQILANEKKYNVSIPWYIMTSPINDADTRAFFADNNNFSLNRQNIFMFPQGVMPSFDKQTGRMLLADKHTLAVNPDGHGGSIRALAQSGAIEDMAARGIKHISYFQVDNPVVKIIDPLFIGLHATAPESSGEMSSKMLPKANATEKVGVFCQANGKTLVIEYSDLPPELGEQTLEDGSLRFLAGSIAIHLIGVDFVAKLTSGGSFALPWHRAEKKVPHVNTQTGEMVNPQEANGVKLESFVFEAINFAESSIVYETTRVEEFAPIKNATGVDSVVSSQQLQTERNARWLEKLNISVPRDADGNVEAKIEISPLTALCADDLKDFPDLPESITAGDEIAL